MFNRTACHMVLDCVLDEIEAGVNYVDFGVSSLGVDVHAQVGPFDEGGEVFIDETYYPSKRFTRHHAYAIMRQFDELADMGTDAAIEAALIATHLAGKDKS